MTFSTEQLKQLQAPLSRACVKTRQQSGQQLSYLEGWHVIAEANRIFGFDAWDRTILDMKCVAEREVTIGKTNPKPGWAVTYTAQVMIRVGLIQRTGCGAGHGRDADLGQAHESALKEAETDAMKRALMTFGNPFGLALYDKQQKQVADGPSAVFAAGQSAIMRAQDADALAKVVDRITQRQASGELTEEEVKELMANAEARYQTLGGSQ